MSSENVDLVRDGLEAFLAGDIERALEFADRDVVTFRAPPLPDARAYHGREGMLQTYVEWTAEFGEFEMTTEQFVDAGDHVMVEILQRGEGQASGAVVEGRFWLVYTVADGKVVRLDIFNGKNQALRAAGLA